MGYGYMYLIEYEFFAFLAGEIDDFDDEHAASLLVSAHEHFTRTAVGDFPNVCDPLPRVSLVY